MDTRDLDEVTPAAARRFPATPSSVGQARRFLLGTLPDPGRRRRHARADAVGAGHQRGAARRHRIRGVRARRPRLRTRARRGQRRCRRVPDAAGSGARCTGRARPAHRARAGRRVGHRDATGPARQDGVVLGAVVRARRWRPGVTRRGAGAAGGAGRAGRAGRVGRRRWRASRRGPCRACGRCSTGCATRSWPPTSRARSVTSTRRPRISWAGPADPWSAGRSSTSCPSHSPRRWALDFGAFVRSRAGDLVGRRIDAVIKRADGTDVNTELVISIFDHPLAGRVVVGILRARDEEKTAPLVGTDERAARDPRRCPHRRTSGRAAALDARTAPRVGRDHAVGGLGQPRARVPARVDAHAHHRPRLRAGEGGRSDQRERRSAQVGARPRRTPVGGRSDGRPALHDRLVGRGRAGERLRLPGPLPRRLRRDRQDAEPSPA